MSSWRNRAKKKYRQRDPLITSAMMSRVKNRDSKAEMVLRRELWSYGLRYRLHSKTVIGRPDIVFAPKKLVVFVDGDFWHGRALIEEGVTGLRRGIRSERFAWWAKKIGGTVERDKLVSQKLTELGWNVMRFWESEVLRDVTTVAKQIQGVLEKVK